MALSHLPGYRVINEVFDETCAALIDCASNDDKAPEVDFSAEGHRDALMPSDPGLSAEDQDVIRQTGEFVRNQMMVERDGRMGGDVCSIYHRAWVAGFDPAFNQYDRVAWEIEKLMRMAIIAKTLPVYIEENGQSKLLVIDPNEWDWRRLYGDSDVPPGPLGGFKDLDEEENLRLLKISDFREWKISEFGGGLAAAGNAPSFISNRPLKNSEKC
jgi:hypothetical protein